jgi:hypothetical protein
MDDACDPVLDEGHAEIDQQASGRSFVHRGEKFNRSHFHDQFVFHDQIGSEAGVNINAQ